MRMSMHQQLRMEQRQIMAPRMIQSMEILQLPLMQLQERIEQEVEQNPVLELVEVPPEEPSEPVEEEEQETPVRDDQPLVIGEDDSYSEDFGRLSEMAEEFPDHFEDTPRVSRNRLEEQSEWYFDQLANVADRPQTLQDYLKSQLSWFDLDDKTRELAERIIYSLDDKGYLPCSLQDLLGPDASEDDLQHAEEALKVVQRLDPPGVGARDARECLLLQLNPGMQHYDMLKTLLTHHWDDIVNNRLPQIAKRTGYSVEKIQEALQELKTLSLAPGSDFKSEGPVDVVPDVFVEQDENGRYVVRLQERGIPRLRISRQYRKLLEQGSVDSNTRKFIKEKLNDARWLIEAIQQRQRTLAKIAQAIVDHQKEFLDKGPEYIEPLKMQQIADKVGVHVTTVSRAVDGKWIQTPRGMFPLRRFFCGGTVAADGEEVAWDVIRVKLQEIIDKEDKTNPLSDEELRQKLAEQGINVARRTITKYRIAMGIPSSRQRRQWTGSKGKSQTGDSNE